jgi:hypothetical protein
MTEKLLAWYGSQPLKEEVMERLRKHREADSIVQRIYQRLDQDKALGYRGCAIGCTLPPRPPAAEPWEVGVVDEPESWHGEVEDLYGIDARIGEAIDDIFESLPVDECGAFAVDVMEAIPVRADLSEVARWAGALDLQDSDREEARRDAAELIERLRTAPVPTPA